MILKIIGIIISITTVLNVIMLYHEIKNAPTIENDL